MTTFNDTYDKTTPAGTDVPSVIDDRIRETKLAIQERENVDHYWPYASQADVAGGDEVASQYTGEHRKITFYENITDPTQVTGKGHIYMKGGELYYQDATNTTRKLTLAGAINIISADLLGKLANNTYFTGVDNAGTGTVDLIKATTGDIPEIKVGAVLSADTAPAVDAGIANKKYVDTKEAALVTQATASIFGAWTNQDSDSNTLLKDAVYKATSDGFVIFYTTSNNGVIKGYTDGSNPPTTQRTHEASYISLQGANGMMPVRKDDYWKVTDSAGTPTIYWLPIGTGECQKQ